MEKFAAEIASRQVGKQLETRSMQPNLRPLYSVVQTDAALHLNFVFSSDETGIPVSS